MFEYYEEILGNIRLRNIEKKYKDLLSIPDPKNLTGITTLSNFLINSSIFNSKKLLNLMEEKIDNQSTKESQFINFSKFLGELDKYIKRLEEDIFFKDLYSFFATDLRNRKEELVIKYNYLNEVSLLKDTKVVLQNHSNKIQWLGKTNVLATLLYDLWKGQDKGKGKAVTSPLIKADKKDLEKLLIENFIDSKGEPLTIATISDYLNTSKPEKRAKIGSRIEL